MKIATDGQGGRWPEEDTCPGSGATAYPEGLPLVGAKCGFCGRGWVRAQQFHHKPYKIPPHPRGDYLLPEEEGGTDPIGV
jgi:hypothetical protein